MINVILQANHVNGKILYLCINACIVNDNEQNYVKCMNKTM